MAERWKTVFERNLDTLCLFANKRYPFLFAVRLFIAKIDIFIIIENIV